MHRDRLADDESIGNEFADGLTGVGVRDLVDLVGIEPDLAFPATNDGGGEALLGAEIDPVAVKDAISWERATVAMLKRR